MGQASEETTATGISMNPEVRDVEVVYELHSDNSFLYNVIRLSERKLATVSAIFTNTSNYNEIGRREAYLVGTGIRYTERG
jgi:hypothetical protein